MANSLAVIVLAAGLGTRTKVRLPKVLLPLCGRSMLGTVLHTVAELRPDRTVVVLHHGKDLVEKHLEKLDPAVRRGMVTVDQGAPRGTGHAVQQALAALEGNTRDVLVVYGDVPLISVETLQALREARGDDPASILTAFASPPEGMGRILRDDAGELLGIREQKDCSSEERAIEEFNAGFYCFDGAKLPAALASLSPANAQGELYLTDTIGWFLSQGQRCESVTLSDSEEVHGVNDLRDLAVVRTLMQDSILIEHMSNGVMIEDPGTTFIDQGVSIGADTRVLPCSVIRTGVSIGTNCEVGPFSHLRVETELKDGAEVGNFVEAKKTVIGEGTKAKHLTYLGDTTIGKQANIGAGTITANYDGKHKHQTTIGDGAFVGSGTVLVAPTTMGEKSMTGAGAVVTRNTTIADGEVVVGVPARVLKRDNARDPA